MKYTADGRIVHGIGGSGVWVDGVELVGQTAGEAYPLDSTRAAYQSIDGHVSAIGLDGKNPTVLDPRPSSYIAADVGIWRAFLADGRTGVYGPGFSKPEAGLLGVVGGVTIIKTSYQSGGIEAWIDQNTRLWDVQGAQPNIYNQIPQFSALDVQRCIWSEGNGILKTRGLPAPAQVHPELDPVLLELNGQVWLLSHFSHLTLRPLTDSSKGYTLTTGYSYGPCVRVLDATHVEVAWSTNAGEIGVPTRLTVDLSAPMEELEPLTYPTFGPFTHPVIVVPFKDPEGTSGAPAEVVVNLNNQTVNRPVFIGGNPADYTIVGPLQGLYTESEDPRSVITVAATLKTRVVWVHDGQTVPVVPSVLRPWDQVWLELYRYPNESLAESRARWIAQMTMVLTAWPGDIGVIPMFYCMGGAPPSEVWSVQQVLDGLVYLTGIVNMSPRIKVVGPFEFLRGNGITAHPPLLHALNDLLAAMWRDTQGRRMSPVFTPVGVPVPPPPPPPPPDPHPDPNPDLEDPTMTYGHKFLFRKADPVLGEQRYPDGTIILPGTWLMGVVVKHGRDETYLNKATDGSQMLIYAVSATYPSGAGNWITWNDKGEIGGYQNDPNMGPGGAERVTFEGRFMLVRPGCGKDGSGVAVPYHVLRLL